MDRLTLKNYRCFRHEQTVRLAPLTLLVGENSTGKTSFLALIKALWDVAHRHRVPNFKEEPYDLGSFDEIAHYRGGRGGRAASFEAGFAYTPRPEQTAGFHVVFERGGTAPVPVKRRLANLDKDVWIEHDLPVSGDHTLRYGTPRGSWQWDIPRESPDGFLIEVDPLAPMCMLLTDLSFRPARSNADAERPNRVDLKSVLHLAIFEDPFNPALYAGAPVRSKPHRTYDPARVARDSEGDYIPMYLANEYFEDKKRWGSLKERLEAFGQQAGLFDEISIKPLGKQTGPFQVQVRRFTSRAKGPERNLIDVGYGVSQVLPVITELLRPDTPPMFLLQQPEVHLHPSAQAALGSLFCDVAGPKRQLIVETHSDHLIDRVRMDVRDGETKLKPNDVSILYFERKGLHVSIHSLGIDRDGNITGAPAGYRRFFMEETTRSLWKRKAR